MNDTADLNAGLSKEIDAAISALEKTVAQAVKALQEREPKQSGKRRPRLSKPRWAAIRYLYIVEDWGAATLAARFGVSASSIWMRCKREKWRSKGTSDAPDPAVVMSDVSTTNSLLVNLAAQRSNDLDV